MMQAAEQPFINAIYDKEPLDKLVYGRVALMGDAAREPSSPTFYRHSHKMPNRSRTTALRKVAAYHHSPAHPRANAGLPEPRSCA